MKPEELDITEVTEDFGEIYSTSKEWEKLKKTAQEIFFKAATQERSKERLPRMSVVTLEGPKWIEDHYPGWRIIDSDDGMSVPGGTFYLLEEDPSLMEYVFTNPDDGMVYKRSRTEGGARLDDERLKEEDPDLFEEISEWTEPTQVIRDKSTWTDEQAARIKPYLLPGKVGVKLEPPRVAKKRGSGNDD